MKAKGLVLPGAAISIALGALTFSSVRTDAQQPNPDFASIVWAEWHTEYRGTQRTTIPGGKMRPFDAQVIQKRDGRRSVRVVAPPPRVGEIQVDDGAYTWRFTPRRNIVMLSPSKAAHHRNPEKPKVAPVIQMAGIGMVAGRPTTTYVITPAKVGSPPLKLCVDTHTLVPLRTESQGPRRLTQEFTEINYGNQPDVRFQWPGGASLMAPVWGGPKRQPVLVPMPLAVPIPLMQDIVFDGVWLRSIEGRGVLWLHFHLRRGKQQFSLFETLRGPNGSPPPDGSVLNWNLGDLNVTLVGNLPPAMQERVRHSIHIVSHS